MSRFVLITRHPADCAELQDLVKDSGVTLRPYPVFRLEDVDDDGGWNAVLSPSGPSGPTHDESRQDACSTNARDGLLGGLPACPDPVPDRSGKDSPSWVIMASPRAPERFVRQCRERGAEHLLDLPVAVVGKGTAKASAASGLIPEIVGPGTGLGLAEALNERWGSATTTVFACGHDRRPELPNALTNAGHRVLPVEVYRMRPTPPRELPPLGPSLEAVIVTSPRAARLYLDGVGGRPLPCPHWALGPTTRDAARSMGIECRIPPEPNLESLAEELCRI